MTSTSPAIGSLPSKRRLSAAYFFVFIILGLTSGIVGPTLPTLAAHTHATLGQISIIFTAQSIGYLLGSAGSGHWLDRWPAHPLLLGMLIVLAGALIAAPFANLLVVLALVFFIMGIAQSTVDVGGNALLVWVHGHGVGPYMNALHFFFGVGALLSPILVVALIDLADGMAWAYISLSILVLPALLLLRRLPSPSSPASPQASGRTSPQNHLALLISIMFFLFVGAELSFAGWIYTYAIELHLANAVTAGYLTSLFWGALTLGRLLSIPLANRISPQRLLLLDISGQIIILLLMLSAGPRGGIVWVVSFGFGFTMASIFPTLMSLAERNMPISGRTTSWFLVSASLGVMTMPWVIGQLFEQVGPQGLVWVLTAAVLAAALTLGLFNLVCRRQAASVLPQNTPT